MRRVAFTSEAERNFESQLGYLIERGAVGPARALKERAESFLTRHLSTYPRSGKHIAERGIWETWIPGTRLVVWYSFTDEDLTVIAVWHTSQDRGDAN